jgi:hypothetical protein
MGAEKKLRLHFGDYLVKAEVFIYSVLAVLLFITALATLVNAGKILWAGWGTGQLQRRRSWCWTNCSWS